jgi:hypothetical protein
VFIVSSYTYEYYNIQYLRGSWQLLRRRTVKSALRKYHSSPDRYDTMSSEFQSPYKVIWFIMFCSKRCFIGFPLALYYNNNMLSLRYKSLFSNRIHSFCKYNWLCYVEIKSFEIFTIYTVHAILKREDFAHKSWLSMWSDCEYFIYYQSVGENQFRFTFVISH